MILLSIMQDEARRSEAHVKRAISTSPLDVLAILCVVSKSNRRTIMVIIMALLVFLVFFWLVNVLLVCLCSCPRLPTLRYLIKPWSVGF